MKKRFSCALLGLALMIGLSGHALAAENVTAPVVVDGVEQTNFHATLYGDTTYTSFYGVTLALRPDAVITWENNQLVARADDFTMYARIGTNFLVINDRDLHLRRHPALLGQHLLRRRHRGSAGPGYHPRERQPAPGG